MQGAVSVTVVIPFNVVVWVRFLDEGVGDGVIATSKALGIAVNQYRLLSLVHVDSAASWTVSYPLVPQLFLNSQLSAAEFVQDVGVVFAV